MDELIDPSHEDYCAFLGYGLVDGAIDSGDFCEVLQCAVDCDPAPALADHIVTQKAIKA